MSPALALGAQTFILIVLAYSLFKAIKKFPKNIAIGITIFVLATMATIVVMAVYYPKTLTEWLGYLNIDAEEYGI